MQSETKPEMRPWGKKPTSLRQQRLVTVVTPKEKKQAEKLATLFFDGNIGNLMRALLKERYETYLFEKKSSKVKLPEKTSPFVGRKHAATTKPTGKTSTRNSAARSAKSSSAKNGVAAKGRSKSSGASAKGRRTSNRSS